MSDTTEVGAFTGLSDEQLYDAFFTGKMIQGFYIRQIDTDEHGRRKIVLENLTMRVTLYADGRYEVEAFQNSDESDFQEILRLS